MIRSFLKKLGEFYLVLAGVIRYSLQYELMNYRFSNNTGNRVILLQNTCEKFFVLNCSANNMNTSLVYVDIDEKAIERKVAMFII